MKQERTDKETILNLAKIGNYLDGESMGRRIYGDGIDRARRGIADALDEMTPNWGNYTKMEDIIFYGNETFEDFYNSCSRKLEGVKPGAIIMSQWKDLYTVEERDLGNLYLVIWPEMNRIDLEAGGRNHEKTASPPWFTLAYYEAQWEKTESGTHLADTEDNEYTRRALEGLEEALKNGTAYTMPETNLKRKDPEPAKKYEYREDVEDPDPFPF